MNDRVPDLIPVVEVSDLYDSVGYYTNVLGFGVAEFDTFYGRAQLRLSSSAMEASNDWYSEAVLYLQVRGGDRRHMRMAIGLHADVERFKAYFGQLKERGARIVKDGASLDRPFCIVRDPDGYFIDFARYVDPLPVTGDD